MFYMKLNLTIEIVILSFILSAALCAKTLVNPMELGVDWCYGGL